MCPNVGTRKARQHEGSHRCQDSDVYDALAFVAYAAETRTRSDRVRSAKPEIAKAFSDNKQREFIHFILDKYVEDGINELAAAKMRNLIKP